MSETPIPTFARQSGFDVRCEWGRRGVLALRDECDVLVVVDAFSFSTSVDIAVSRGAVVFPYRWRDETTAAFAQSVGAILAGKNVQGLALKPHTLEHIAAGTRLVLPSPNGSHLSVLTGATPTLAGCFRNAAAVAAHAASSGAVVGVIAAGEIWSDGLLRPSFEDQCAAGAVIAHLPGERSRSPDASAAAAVFESSRADLAGRLAECASGREKQSNGLLRDIELVAELCVSDAVPMLVDGAYVDICA
jgi:2-phosphosulfolactate phosphatase